MAESMTRAEQEMREQLCDERFARDKERIEKSEEIIDELKTLSTQMGALLKQHDKKLEDHDERIGRLEQKPAKRWDSFVGKVIELVLAFGFGGLLVWLGLKDSI